MCIKIYIGQRETGPIESKQQSVMVDAMPNFIEPIFLWWSRSLNYFFCEKIPVSKPGFIVVIIKDYSRPGIIEHNARFTFGNKQSPRILRINSSVAQSGIK